MDPRKPLDGFASSVMIGLCIIWGVQQVAIKSAAADIAPLLQVALRSGLAGFAVMVLMLIRQRKIPFSAATLLPGLLVGLLFSVEFMFVAEGLRFTTAAHMAVFLYTAPLFAALGLHFLVPEERLSALQWSGVGVTFIGVIVAFMFGGHNGAVPQASNMLLGDFFGLLAGAFWGMTTIVVRRSALSSGSATMTLFYQLAGAFVLLGAMALLTGQTQLRFTPVSVSSMLFQTVIVTFASYLAWFSLLRRYQASRLGILSFMTPVFGIIAGVVLLHEPLKGNFILGALLILLGIMTVSAEGLLRQWVAKRRRAV
ncbi:threonine/homoserine efflux transporter RhtA [Rahnella sp. BIGb0236]|uniref:DMT family transporter n=1 Tax=Rahnella sp. BIGb0236 TaxID=2485117 RepID=UPI00105F5EB0|nr:DMT family transporter [Rahnella sp. BIGb0236]TDS98160.1 threonine/homoserine efflux transporter RhtA [Rahnella sp. BIGb0236]VTQ52224.1 Probable amino-acid metabolite efflux pump [Campylobacter jejuni]